MRMETCEVCLILLPPKGFSLYSASMLATSTGVFNSLSTINYKTGAE